MRQVLSTHLILAARKRSECFFFIMVIMKNNIKVELSENNNNNPKTVGAFILESVFAKHDKSTR